MSSEDRFLVELRAILERYAHVFRTAADDEELRVAIRMCGGRIVQEAWDLCEGVITEMAEESARAPDARERSN